MVCHRPHAGCPRQRLETGAVEIRFAAEAFPAGYRHHRFEASEIGKSDDIAAVRPVHFETARRGGRRAAIADIDAKDTKLQAVVAVKRVEAATVVMHLSPAPLLTIAKTAILALSELRCNKGSRCNRLCKARISACRYGSARRRASCSGRRPGHGRQKT